MPISPPTDPIDPLEILGTTGLFRSSGYVFEEWHRELSGLKAAKVYREMVDNDPIIGAGLGLINALLAGVEWRTEAATGPNANPAIAEDAAALLDSCTSDMSHTWQDLIYEALSMLPWGYAPMELVYKLRHGPDQQDPRFRSKYDDGRWGWRKIQLRGQESTLRWELQEDGGIQGLYQRGPPDWKERYIPIDKMLLFRAPQTTKNNPEGRSLLRNAYIPYKYAKRHREVEAIGVARDLTGMPDQQVPAEWLSPNATPQQKAVVADLKTSLAKIQRDEREYLLRPAETDRDGKPTGFKFGLVSTGGRRQMETDAIVRRYEQRIAMVMATQFLLLGSDSTGARSLADSHTDTLETSLKAVLKIIADVLNCHGVPRLMRLNGIAVENHPHFEHGDLKREDVGAVADALGKLVLGGFIGPIPADEANLRERFHLPQREAASVNSTPPAAAPTGPAVPTQPPAPAPATR